MKTFYSPSGNPEIWDENNVPKGYFTEEQWISNKNNNIELVFDEKMKEIDALCKMSIENISEDYSKEEISTFEKQEKEAREYLKNKDADIPFIKSIAEIRNMSIDELANKIIEKNDIYSKRYGEIIGQRQKLEKTIKELKEQGNVKKLRETHIYFS